MNLFHVFGRAFIGIGKGILAALRFADKHGLTDDLVNLALRHVMDAQAQFATNDERREYVVSKLKGHFVPESIARLAVELAVAKYKASLT